MDTLLLLDSPGLWFRAFYGVKSPAKASNGTPVNAVRGFLDTTARLIRDHRPGHLVACLDDDWRPQWRVDLIPSYKTHRLEPERAAGDAAPDLEAVPDDLSPQVEVICALLEAAGIPTVGLPDCEADDVIGTLATHHHGRVLIATGDRDLFQLVDERVNVLYSVEQHRVYGPAEVTARFGVPGTGYADFALLRGDASDGLPGVKGVGEKTAALLIQQFGGVTALLAACEQGPLEGIRDGIRQKLLLSKDYLHAAAPVVRVLRDAPLPSDLSTSFPDANRIREALGLAGQWNCTAALERLVAAAAAVADG